MPASSKTQKMAKNFKKVEKKAPKTGQKKKQQYTTYFFNIIYCINNNMILNKFIFLMNITNNIIF